MEEVAYGPGDRVTVRFEPENTELVGTVVKQQGQIVSVALDLHATSIDTGVHHVSRYQEPLGKD